MKMTLKPNKHDIFIGSFIIVLIVSLIISVLSLKNSDDHYVYIKYDGQVVHQMDLYKDEVYVLEKEEYKDLLGDFEVTVKNGKVFISENTCPQDFCKHVGEISFKGQSLICAPNRIVVEIGEKLESECDWGVCYEG
ncbi:MAG: hypothetical protein E7177_07935 [Erysipelotrichaceae bacterium]|nr:hypothetical protein [Erysipelotrichaceae bacterium]